MLLVDYKGCVAWAALVRGGAQSATKGQIGRHRLSLRFAGRTDEYVPTWSMDSLQIRKICAVACRNSFVLVQELVILYAG